MQRLIYRMYRLFHGVSQKLIRRVTPAGLLLLVALVVTAVFGLDTNLTMAYQIFTLLLALTLVSLISALFFRGRFSIERKTPRFATAGESLTYRLGVFNGSNRRQRGLSVMEEQSDPRPSFEEFESLREPLEARRNVFDRYFGYYRWLWLVNRRRVNFREHAVPDLAAGGRAEVVIEGRPARRGQLRLEGTRICRRDPFGFWRSAKRIPADDTVTVIPRRYAVPPLSLPGRRRYQSGGVALASSVGDSEEFIALRDYRPGDPLRNIHWKSWAKTEKPVVKEYQDEFFVRHALVLDTFHASGSDEMFEEAVSVAASLVSPVLTQESLLDLLFVGTEAYCFTAGRGLAHLDGMMEILASVRICRDKPFQALPPLVLERAAMLSGCICILLDWDPDRRDFIKNLRALGLPLKVFVMTESGSDQDPDPGPMADLPSDFHVLAVGRVEEGLAGV